jgi:3-oxoacyl-[acyl-carrier protein] reductase
VDLGLAGKAVLITGGNRGLGAALALAFAAEGADVGISARDGERLAAVQEQVEALGVRCVAVVADLARTGECERVVAEVAQQLGRLDILVNNASTNVTGVIKTDPVEHLMQRVSGKATWAIRCTQAALPHLIASKAGRVIFIGGTALRSSYPAGAARASHGVVAAMGSAVLSAFAKYLQEEVIGDNVLVNVVHPGSLRTDRFPGRVQQYADEHGLTYDAAEARIVANQPLRRMLEPADVTPAVLFLASPHASAISAQALGIDGGTFPVVQY